MSSRYKMCRYFMLLSETFSFMFTTPLIMHRQHLSVWNAHTCTKGGWCINYRGISSTIGDLSRQLASCLDFRSYTTELIYTHPLICIDADVRIQGQFIDTFIDFLRADIRHCCHRNYSSFKGLWADSFRCSVWLLAAKKESAEHTEIHSPIYIKRSILS